jgi:hypothetical protein
MMRLVTPVIAATLLPFAVFAPAPVRAAPRAGEVYELKLDRRTEFKSDDSEGNSTDQDALIERVILVRDGGVEVEYDLPTDVTAEDRARVWQMPARIFKPVDGPMQLLNAPELEARVERWLKAAKYDRTACGRWIFTWNAFQIECDPQSVIDWVRAFDLGSAALREGVSYGVPGALASVPLAVKSTGRNRTVYTAVLAADPAYVRRGLVESEMIAAEITGNPVTLEEALRNHASDRISGTITVTIETDSAGYARRRAKVVKLTIADSNGKVETRTATESLSRRLVTSP